MRLGGPAIVPVPFLFGPIDPGTPQSEITGAEEHEIREDIAGCGRRHSRAVEEIAEERWFGPKKAAPDPALTRSSANYRFPAHLGN